jgi:hypothetical protein
MKILEFKTANKFPVRKLREELRCLVKGELPPLYYRYAPNRERESASDSLSAGQATGTTAIDWLDLP